jgi:hypothetical protein
MSNLDTLKRLVAYAEVNEKRVGITIQTVPDVEFINNYGNDPFGLVQVTIPQTVEDIMKELKA